MGVTKQNFGKSPEEKEVFLYELKNKNGAVIKVTDFGAILVSVEVPDKDGKLVDVVLGYDKVEGYYVNPPHFGSPIGRNGNRIGGAKFVINGKEYKLAENDNINNLHSGPDFYRTRVWDVAEIDEDLNSITFKIFSPDGDQGFPGNFTGYVTYRLTDDNEVVMHYEGSADADTIVNMTNHSYFNLSGHGAGAEEMLNHTVQIHAPEYTPVSNAEAIPTGEIASVSGTPMDFTSPKKIGQDVEADFEQLIFGGGYDHNYALTREKGEIKEAAVVHSDTTGITMKVYTDLPGMQFYIGNFIKNENGKEGCVYSKRAGFCMETQYYPNACNEENFQSSLLKAGDKYDTTTIYKFLSE